MSWILDTCYRGCLGFSVVDVAGVCGFPVGGNVDVVDFWSLSSRVPWILGSCDVLEFLVVAVADVVDS